MAQHPDFYPMKREGKIGRFTAVSSADAMGWAIGFVTDVGLLLVADFTLLLQVRVRAAGQDLFFAA